MLENLQFNLVLTMESQAEALGQLTTDDLEGKIHTSRHYLHPRTEAQGNTSSGRWTEKEWKGLQTEVSELSETVLKIPRFTDNIFTHLLAGPGAGFLCSFYWLSC